MTRYYKTRSRKNSTVTVYYKIALLDEKLTAIYVDDASGEFKITIAPLECAYDFKYIFYKDYVSGRGGLGSLCTEGLLCIKPKEFFALYNVAIKEQ